MTFPEALLTGAFPPTEAPTPEAHLSALRERVAGVERPVDRALLGGFAADRVGLAFAAGYREALRCLVPALDATVISFSATEAAGNHPRAIAARLAATGDGFTLCGAKRWATLGPVADELLVVCTDGEHDGRPRLRVARVRRGQAGVAISCMPPTPFVPEVLHAEVALDDVAVSPGDVLPGDGYSQYLKPFRTIEDVHVHAAIVGYLLGVAHRSAWPKDDVARLAAVASALRDVAGSPVLAPATHVALAGVLDVSARLLDALAPRWASAPEPERERWERDRGLVVVAGKARAQRLDAAWRDLGQGGARRPASLASQGPTD